MVTSTKKKSVGTTMEVEEFLRESNAIEGVYDKDSLKQARLAWEHVIGEKTMTPEVVCQTHSILMKHKAAWSDPTLLRGAWAGRFREMPVYVGWKEGMKYDLIPDAIEDWCKQMNVRDIYKDYLPGLSRSLHVEYEKIHPFADGNGRTGRIFMNWWRLRNGLPILTIHEGLEQRAYYGWFV